MNPNTPSPFFASSFGSNQQEVSWEDLAIEGKIPEWLSGNLVRNGPGLVRAEYQDLSHWFDGQAALHSFSIQRGKVNYRCRYLQTESYKFIRDNQKLTHSEFATDPCKSLFRKLQSHIIPSPPNMTDNAKVNVAKIGDIHYALGETSMMIEFDPETLHTGASREVIPGGFAYKTTAHPHFDRSKAYNLVVKFGMFCFYRIIDLDRPKKFIGNIPVTRPAYMHGFGMSSKYFIIAAGPLTAVPINLLYWKRPFIENHTWNPKDGGRFYVIERATGKLKATFKTDPFFTFHPINAWEEGEDLVIDLDAYDDASIIQQYYMRELEKPDVRLPFGTVRRYRLNLRTRRYEVERRSDACIELPRIDYDRFNMSGDYKHVYGVSIHPTKREGFYNSLVKINPDKGTNKYWFEEGTFPGEPVFVPSPQSKSDDEGAVLSIVLDSRNQTSFLLVLDACSFEEMARVHVPEPITYGFHTEFFR